ncbi:DNA ligase 1-like [Impatiens glandulifera]|uniref:DNA ligase 1-like n=1 Tax=Impatiens glandulifera TaxID=253017 RepID=UPI001FB19CED|nr:DNA ligase 1-like [Impatiens glandulifera]
MKERDLQRDWLKMEISERNGGNKRKEEERQKTEKDNIDNIYDELFGCDTRKRNIDVFEEKEKHERTPKPPTKKSRHISPKVPEVNDETSQESSSHSIPSATTPIPTEDKSTSCAPNRVSQDITDKLDVLTNIVNGIKKDVNEIKSEIKLMKENQQLIITLLGQRNEQKNGGGEEKEEAGTAAIDTEKRTTKRKNNDLALVENRTKRKNDDVDNENRTKRKNDELMNSKRKNDEKMKKTKEDDDEITRKRNERKERRERLNDEEDDEYEDEETEEEDEEIGEEDEETGEEDEETEEEDEKTEENDEKTEENDKIWYRTCESPRRRFASCSKGEERGEVDKEIVKEVIVETEEKKKEKNKGKEKKVNDVKQLTPSQFVGKSFRRKKKSKQLGDYTDPGGKEFKLNDPVKVNPLLRIDEEKMKELKKWLKSDGEDFKESTVCSADRSFFNRLLKPQEWLHDTEIDEICHLMKRRVAEFPKTYPKNFSIADSKFSQKTNNRYDMFTPNPAGYKFDDLMEYVFGEGSNPWNIVDMIYVPLNLKQKHWVLCKIHLQDWCIYVYDYEQNMFPKDEYDDFLKPMCVIVPYLLELGFTTGDKERFPQIKLDRMSYSIIPHPTVPKTTKSGDCGVLLLCIWNTLLPHWLYQMWSLKI